MWHFSGALPLGTHSWAPLRGHRFAELLRVAALCRVGVFLAHLFTQVAWCGRLLVSLDTQTLRGGCAETQKPRLALGQRNQECTKCEARPRRRACRATSATLDLAPSELQRGHSRMRVGTAGNAGQGRASHGLPSTKQLSAQNWSCQFQVARTLSKPHQFRRNHASFRQAAQGEVDFETPQNPNRAR